MNTFPSVKRLIGKRFNEVKDQLSMVRTALRFAPNPSVLSYTLAL